MHSMTGVGADPAQEPRMHSVKHRLLYVFMLPMVWTFYLGGWSSLALAQISASPHTLWQPPDLHGHTRALQASPKNKRNNRTCYILAPILKESQGVILCVLYGCIALLS